MGGKRRPTTGSRKRNKKARFEVVEVEESPDADEAAEVAGQSGSTRPMEVVVDSLTFGTTTSGRSAQYTQRRNVTVDPAEQPATINSGGSGRMNEEDRPGDMADVMSAIFDGLPVAEAEALEHDVQAKHKERKRPELRAALRQWLPARQDFLDELLAYAGCNEAIDEEEVLCAVCQTHPATVRCEDCFRRPIRCKGCVLESHSEHLLHRLEEWDGRKFVRTSLEKLGMVVNLGHSHNRCPNPSQLSRRLVICDSTGIHTHTVRFCKCLDATAQDTAEWRQLMRFGWFPATMDRPATVFTFRMLKTFQELSFQGKTNLYDYWRTIERITDGPMSRYNRYKQLSHVVRLWRHLVMLKRFGRAHDPAGAAATKPGELVVECAACPHPGKNIPADWESAPPDVKWMYTLYLMIDANFRARCKDRGFDDVELAPGWSYYVEETAYQAHVKASAATTCANAHQENTCSAEHNAILKANLRREGYVASGIGAVLCARHGLVRKNGAGDLQHGERSVHLTPYANMDYLVFSTLMGVIVMLLLSYDIACQWCKRFYIRMQENFPPAMRIDRTKVKSIRFAIPKHHYRVHGGEPHSRWSLNFLKWVARTVGEGIESHWSHMNPLATSTREMSPGMRHEVYNDHWGAWNWQKTIAFGIVLLRALQEARDMAVKQRKIYEDYSANFTPAVLGQWESMVDAWNADPDQPDPYEEPTTAISMASEKLRLGEEEAVEAAQGKLPPHEVTPAVLLQVGLELEEAQRALRLRASSGRSITDLAATQQKRNILMRRIELWQAIQDVHMPVVAPLRAAHVRTQTPLAVPKAEDVLLFLPSALSLDLLSNETLAGLREKERRLRVAQMSDALAEIRRIRRVLAAISEFRKLNVNGTGQRAVTRNLGLYERFMTKQKRSAQRYRDARTAMEKLEPGGAWTQIYRPLLDGDLRGPRREDDEVIPSEGRYEISWIWLTLQPTRDPRDQNAPATDEEFTETMRAEWARSKARVDRWDEDRTLLLEEMRRVLEFFEDRAHWWREQGARRTEVDARLKRGLMMYAEKQASVFEALALRTASFWVNYLREMGPLPSWILPYESHARKLLTLV
ncbi:hypothetical protein C8Q76DRAFT_772031 [Earliella scabrosa]|nr:hypothetical protein C8Q76DRAFT_772031 [Earliella scabrosa]